jgi:methylphosphotriester-DNA--protein-cysteine methyltransferase
MVIGRDWLLEMVQSDNGRTYGFFFAPFAIIRHLPKQHGLRVSEAMGRLCRGEDILEAGYDSGFNDTTRFSSAFRRLTGTSPGKCRRRIT